MTTHIHIRIAGSNALVCSAAELADSAATRLVGLLGRAGLPQQGGLLIVPSTGVHTFGMRFPIDIVALDSSRRVLSTHAEVGPWKVRGLARKTASVLELPAGRIAACGLALGDELLVEHC
jgi:uncharacterized membrane protein (UPF0127 family)